MHAKRVSTSRSIQSVLFQTTFEPKLVAEASKELVFVLSQRKIRCATTSLFGVGGSGRRPLESADPWSRRGGRRRGALSSRRSSKKKIDVN